MSIKRSHKSKPTRLDKLGNKTMNQPIAVTIPEAVRLSGRSRSAVYEALAKGELPARKAGRRTLILYADLQAYIAALPQYQAGA